MTAPADAPGTTDRSFVGHPRGLATLSGLEVWERFSFLGMQAILVLYFVASDADGGLGLPEGQAASVGAAYGVLVYLVSVGGGWMADRVLGSYRCVLAGGVLIAAGHYVMAVPADAATWLGLVLISVGTGLLKPNVSAMVGALYATADERRAAGFSIYYAAINLGAFLGPLVTGALGEGIGWHWGFSAAAVGMTLGLVQYVRGRRHLPGHGAGPRHPLPPAALRRTVLVLVGALVALVVVVAVLAAAGALCVGGVVDALTVVAVAAPLAYAAVLARSRRVTAEERGRLRPFAVLWLASVAFNTVLFQAYTVLILLGSRDVDRGVGGWDFPASWFSSALGLGEVLVAPLVAGLWLRLGPRQPHASVKIATGVVLGGLSYLLLVPALAGDAGEGARIALWTMLLALLLLGTGDVLLQTTGLSATSKLAPAAFSSQGMALWFLSIAAANAVAAQTVQLFGVVPDAAYLGVTGGVAVVVGAVVLLLRPWLARTMHPVH